MKILKNNSIDQVKESVKQDNHFRRGISVMLVIILLMSSLSMTAFGDAPSPWAETSIQTLEQKNLLRADMFNDYKSNISRLDYAYLVYKLVEAYGISISDIADVNKDYTLTDCDDYYVIGCFKAGIINGLPNKTYAPDQPITRQEICTLYMKALEKIQVTLSQDASVLLPFQDAGDMGPWAEESIIKCLDNGIINGTSATTLDPLGYSTVEQSLVIFNRIIENTVISEQITATQKNTRPSAMAYEDSLTYYVYKDLIGQNAGVKTYEDYTLLNEVAVDDIDSGIMAYDGMVYYINTDGQLTRLDVSSGSRFRVEGSVCDSFTIGGDRLYAIYGGQVYTHNLEGGTIGPATQLEELVDAYVDIGYYFNELETSKVYLFLTTADGKLYRYHDNDLDLVAGSVMAYEVCNNEIYYTDDGSRLMKTPLNMSILYEMADNVRFFGTFGQNILYITNDGALYNSHRGILGERLYTGDLTGMALDYNYLEITESLVGDSEFNHLMALFYTKEYFGN